MADMTELGEPRKKFTMSSPWLRKTFAGCKLAADADGEPLLFPKENFSNGCIATVDVIYPRRRSSSCSARRWQGLAGADPEYAASGRWKFPFAPHDLGTYPLANGQVYGGGERTEKNQMPVEESGNMLMLLAADREDGGQRRLRGRLLAPVEEVGRLPGGEGVRPGEPALHRRLRRAPGPQRQPLGQGDPRPGAYGHWPTCGEKAEAGRSSALAESLAGAAGSRWRTMATTSTGLRPPGTWSQKYNLVWDKLLGLDFSRRTLIRGVASTSEQWNAYGLPLDNREALRQARLDGLDRVFDGPAPRLRARSFRCTISSMPRAIAQRSPTGIRRRMPAASGSRHVRSSADFSFVPFMTRLCGEKVRRPRQDQNPPAGLHCPSRRKLFPSCPPPTRPPLPGATR